MYSDWIPLERVVYMCTHRLVFVQYLCACTGVRVCMCVHCSHRQTHGSLRSGEYYRGVDHRGTRPIANRQAPLINPLHTDAFPLCLSLSLCQSVFSLLIPLCVCVSVLFSLTHFACLSLLSWEKSLSYRQIVTLWFYVRAWAP